MKNLSSYLSESKLSTDIIPVANFKHWLANFTKKYSVNSVSLRNKTESKRFFQNFQNECIEANGETTANEAFSKTRTTTLSGFIKYIYENVEDLKKSRVNIEIFKDFCLSKNEQEYKKLKDENPDMFNTVSDDDAKPRSLVVYDRRNPEDHKIYSFVGKRGKATDHQVNMLRVDFHYESGVKYYDCYTCLYDYYSNNVKNKAKMENFNDVIGIDD